MDNARFWLDLVQWLFMMAGGIYIWLTRGRAATTKRVERTEGRLALVEYQLSSMPTHNDLAALNQRIGEMHGELQRLVGGVDGLTRSLELINSHLLEQHR